jgi:hypothetical protein
MGLGRGYCLSNAFELTTSAQQSKFSTHGKRRKRRQGFLGQNLATSNANVVVRNVAHLGVANAHA